MEVKWEKMIAETMGVLSICKGSLAGALPFLLSTSEYYPYMGSWSGDRIVVAGDEGAPDVYRIPAITEGWQEISRPVASAYFDFINESG